MRAADSANTVVTGASNRSIGGQEKRGQYELFKLLAVRK